MRATVFCTLIWWEIRWEGFLANKKAQSSNGLSPGDRLLIFISDAPFRLFPDVRQLRQISVLR